jgi:hypothetical protein
MVHDVVKNNKICLYKKALRERFELPRGVSLNSSQGCRRGPLGYLSIIEKAE